MNEKERKKHNARCAADVNLCAIAGTASLALSFVIGLAAGKLGSEYSDLTYSLSYIVISLASMLLPVTAFYKKGEKLSELLRAEKKSGAYVSSSYMLVGWGACAILNFGINKIAQLFSQTDPDSLKLSGRSLLSVILLGIGLVIVTPVCEELLTRGFIFGKLRPYGNIFAIIVSSVIFAMLHHTIGGIIFALLSGAVLCYIRIASGSLIICMIVHSFNNLLAFMPLVIPARYRQYYLYITVGAVALFLITGLIMLRIRKTGFSLSDKESRKESVGNLKIVVTGSTVFWLYIISAAFLVN